jgi:hypothetical protein
MAAGGPWRRASLAALALAALGATSAPAQIASAAAGPSAGETAQTLRDLVGRYFAWRGPAYEQLQTIHERLRIESAAGPQSGELWMDRDGRTRRETTVAGAVQVEVAAAEGAWRSAPADDPPGDAKGAERGRRYALLAFGGALTGRGGATPQLAGTTEFEDHTWSVVRISFGDDDVYEILLDPASGGLCCYRITEDGVARTELFDDWRLVDGVRMPFGEFTRSVAESAARVSAIELNRAIDPALFQRPKPGG